MLLIASQTDPQTKKRPKTNCQLNPIRFATDFAFTFTASNSIFLPVALPNLFKNFETQPKFAQMLPRQLEKRRSDLVLWSKANTADCDNQRDNKIGAPFSGIGMGARGGLGNCDRVGSGGLSADNSWRLWQSERKTAWKALNFDNFHANEMR